MERTQTALVAEAVARTSAAGIARLWFEAVADRGSLKVLEHARAGRRDPSLRGRVGGVWDKGFELFLGQVLKRGEVTEADGFLDLGARRSAHDYGGYAVLVDSSVQWSGRSGRDLATLDEEPARAPNPLWLFDLLRGVTEALRQKASQCGRGPAAG